MVLRNPEPDTLNPASRPGALPFPRPTNPNFRPHFCNVNRLWRFYMDLYVNIVFKGCGQGVVGSMQYGFSGDYAGCWFLWHVMS